MICVCRLTRPGSFGKMLFGSLDYCKNWAHLWNVHVLFSRIIFTDQHHLYDVLGANETEHCKSKKLKVLSQTLFQAFSWKPIQKTHRFWWQTVKHANLFPGFRTQLCNKPYKTRYSPDPDFLSILLTISGGFIWFLEQQHKDKLKPQKWTLN